MWFLDHNYLENMTAMFRKVNGVCVFCAGMCIIIHVCVCVCMDVCVCTMFVNSMQSYCSACVVLCLYSCSP